MKGGLEILPFAISWKFAVAIISVIISYFPETFYRVESLKFDFSVFSWLRSFRGRRKCFILNFGRLYRFR